MKFAVKVLFISICLLALLGTSFGGTALAASTTKSLSTNYTLVNFGSLDAVVDVQYLKTDGSTWDADPANISFTIPANFGQTQIRQYFDNVMSTGQGSVVVSSSQPLGAVVQIQARNQTPTQGAYSGYSQGSSKFYVPLAAKNRSTASGTANSIITVQNTGTANVDVDIELYAGNTLTYTKSVSGLAPGVSYYYDLETEADANLPDSWIGSAVVDAGTGEVAVVASFFTGPHAMQTFNAFPVESVGTNWAVPLFFSRLPNGLSAVVTVQNLTQTATTIAAGEVELSCVRDTGDAPTTLQVTNPDPIAPNASYSFNPVTDFTNFPVANWGGACRVTSSQPVVAIVQMRYVGVSTQNAASYEAIPEAGTQGTRLVVPLVAKRLANGFASVVTIQNMDMDTVSGETAQISLVYKPSFNASECPIASCDMNSDGVVNESDSITVGPISLPPASSIQRNHRIASGPNFEPTLPSLWQGSLVVTSTNGVPINGFVQLTNYINYSGDTFMAHNAFVLP